MVYQGWCIYMGVLPGYSLGGVYRVYYPGMPPYLPTWYIPSYTTLGTPYLPPWS